MIEILQTKAWALETQFFNQMAPIVLARIAAGKDLSVLVNSQLESPTIGAYRGEDHSQVFRIGKNLMYSGNDGYFYPSEEKGKIIPRTQIQGTITKGGGMCSRGTYEIGQKLLLDDEKENVKAHLIEIDSPGGAVDGTPELASIVKSLSKPVVAFVDGMAASAAYWIASQTDQIISNQLNYTTVGSIGTLAMMVNQGEYLKKEGMKVQIMRAEKSKDKALLNSVEEWPEEALAELQKELNAINEDFVSAVKTGRNGKLMTWTEDIFTGKMYDQKRALSLGMIDQIGTIEDAIKTANRLQK